MIEDREPPKYVTDAQDAFETAGLRAWGAIGDADGFRWCFIVSGTDGEWGGLDIGTVFIVGPEFYEIAASHPRVRLHPERRKVLEDVIVAIGRKLWRGPLPWPMT